jgi:hypothetical protein
MCTLAINESKIDFLLFLREGKVMQLIGGNTKSIKKRRIQITSATFERLSHVIGIGNINKDEVINRLIDSWENSIYNKEVLFHYEEAMREFEKKSSELKLIFKRTIKDSFIRYDKVVEELNEINTKEGLTKLQEYLNQKK